MPPYPGGSINVMAAPSAARALNFIGPEKMSTGLSLTIAPINCIEKGRHPGEPLSARRVLALPRLEQDPNVAQQPPQGLLERYLASNTYRRSIGTSVTPPSACRKYA